MKDNHKAKSFRNDGNSEFVGAKFYEALISYNKSLCQSASSESLSLAYANRAAVCSELKEAEKCLKNIRLARQHGYKNEKKLKERQERAEKLLKEQPAKDPEDDPENFIKLSYPASEKYPPFANCLEVRENQKYGRYVVTSENLNPGDIVAIETTILNTIFQDGRFICCNNCLKANSMSLIPCNGECSSGEFE
jgi:SET and MYND domain-containing protein 4